MSNINSNINLIEVATLLKENNNFVILCHKYPDGDTLGSAVALYHSLKQLNKNVNIICDDKIPKKFEFLFKDIILNEFDYNYIITVDVAEELLLGELKNKFAGKVDLCIDHHSSSKNYAKNFYVDSSAAANAQIIYDLIKVMNVDINKNIANALFTGICTDTGCFKYSNITAKTHEIAANLIDLGANSSSINHMMFDTKTHHRLILERQVLDNLSFHIENKCAISFITKKDIEKSGSDEGDIDGLSGIPRQIEGVKVGILLREISNNVFKISVRTNDNYDASKICISFGGGGHKNAAGCTINKDLNETKRRLIDIVKKIINA